MAKSVCTMALLIFASVLMLCPPCSAAGFITGKVLDVVTGRPIGGAIVTLDGKTVQTDGKGTFSLASPGNSLSARAYGYKRSEPFAVTPLTRTPFEIRLTPFTPKGLYLTVYGIGSRKLRVSALKLVEETELNTLVIDVKGDRGIIPFKSSVATASRIGSQKIITVRDMRDLMKTLKDKGIYTIARIVVFKDNPLATARTGLAVKTGGGEVWHDREGLAWVDPFRKEVWDYNIDIAVEAAQYGFDEIQFDYLRFPDASGLQFSMQSTEENRVKAISGFLAEAKRRLSPYNVFLGADIFGYVCWNLNDTKIGQKIEDLAAGIDYTSPMLYPSGFQFGIPGCRNPVANPYGIVYRSLVRARERTNLPSIRFRPWLQTFRDYAFDRRYFGGRQIREQISAAENFGSNGWLLWNPRNNYSRDGLKSK